MKIAIAAAMKEELHPFREKFDLQKVMNRGKTIIEKAESNNHLFYLVETGIGKVNAAAASSILCETIKPDLIINTGSAGGFSDALAVGDIVFATTLTYGDVDATGFDYVYGQVPQMPSEYKIKNSSNYFDLLNFSTNYSIHKGLVLTLDSFMSNKKTVAAVKSLFPNVLASDMESTALAQIASFYQIPVINIRGISDIVGLEAANMFDENIDKAAQHAFEQTNHLVEQLINNIV